MTGSRPHKQIDIFDYEIELDFLRSIDLEADRSTSSQTLSDSKARSSEFLRGIN
jgi:hypothetical protein